MRLLIDNLDSLGAMDYSGVMAAERPATLARALNSPSVFRVALSLSGTALKVPVRRARVVALSDDATVLFSGYLPSEPEVWSIGAGATGPDALLLLSAESDEWLLDQQGGFAAGAGFGLGGDALVQMLTDRTDPERFRVTSAGAIRSVGLFAPRPTRSWSKNAAGAASAAYAAYRVIAGTVALQPGGAVAHTLRERDGTLDTLAFRLRAAKALANDVTISGEREPASYATEIFTGDGTTAEFVLSAVPFQPTGKDAITLFMESFAVTGSLNEQVWTETDPGSHLSFGAAGLLLGGGTGLDGETVLAARDQVELGGSVVLETGGVVLNAGSDGVIGGVYRGPVKRANCIAGFDVRQNAGGTVVQPLMNGALSGNSLTLGSGRHYVLRTRFYATEMHRALQTYYTMVDGVVESFGGGVVPAAVHAVLEVVDTGAASNTPATVLFDGSIAGTPVAGTFAPVNSVQLLGCVGSVRVTRSGPVLVTSTSTAGVTWTRLTGTAGEGLDGKLIGDRLTFFAGRVPQPGEMVRVVYRTAQRSVARVQDDASVAAEGDTGLPGIAQWAGHILAPVTRNSADCAAAAEALLRVTTSRSSALEGEYTAENPGDVWPGDLLNVEQADGDVALMVRAVEVTDEHSLPEVLRYRVQFANDWAKPFAFELSETLAADLSFPVPVTSVGTVPPESLGSLTVVSVSGSAIQLDMGTVPPAGGGFEVRRRDGGFGPGMDPDLVLRSPVRGFSVPRVAQEEELFVRMFDGSTVPAYSHISAAIFTHVPVS